MTKHYSNIVAAILLITGCVHAPTSSSEQPDRISVTLEDVSLWDALNMIHRISHGTYLTDDSLSRQELKKIRVTMNLKDVTVKEYIKHLGMTTGLSIDEVRYCLFRVVRKGKD
jgi:PBP1b-binding outer membrane lipoprotein LpoB